MAAGMPNTITDFSSAFSLTVVGQDAYWVDSSVNGNRGAVKHAKLDGSGLADFIVPPMGVLFNVSALDDDLYYFVSDDMQKVHMFKSPRATGGVGVQVGTDTYDGFSVNILGGGIAGLQVSESMGVFAKSGTDVFVNEGKISRVSSAGVKTLIAEPMYGAMYPSLIGGKILMKDAMGTLYGVDATATTSSAMTIGTAKCGSGRTMWMGAHANGFICGEIFGIDAIDITGTTKTHVIYTLMDKNPTQFNPTNIDGTTYYALPKEAQKDGAIYKMTVGSNTATAVACGVRAVLDYKMTATDLVYVEIAQDKTTMQTTLNLKRLAR